MRKSNNPVLKNPFQVQATNKVATRRGVVGKTFLGLAVLIISMIVTMSTPALMQMAMSPVFAIVFMIVFIVLAVMSNSNPKLAKPLLFFYSIAEGMMLSSLVLLSELYVPGIGLQAAFIVLLIFGLMLFLYRSFPAFCASLIPVIIACTVVAFIGMIIASVFNLFGVNMVQFGSTADLVITVGLVLLASFNYFVDFQQVDNVVNSNVPKSYEYVAALGLLTTTVWLFVEVLRLLLIFASRNDD